MFLLFQCRGRNQSLRVAWQMAMPQGAKYHSHFKELYEVADCLCSCTLACVQMHYAKWCREMNYNIMEICYELCESMQLKLYIQMIFPLGYVNFRKNREYYDTYKTKQKFYFTKHLYKIESLCSYCEYT